MQKTPDFMPEFKAQLPRSSHVLSHDFGFTATTGHLNPVFHTILNPGETINLGFDFSLRTMPLEAAAFAELICHTEYFFVPMQLLYQPFDTVVYGVSDQFSSMFNNLNNVYLPLEDFDADMTDLNSSRASAAMFYPGTTLPVESVGQSSMRLLDLLGYNPIAIAHADNQGYNWYNPNVFPYPIFAYNCIYQYYYRLDAREHFDQNMFNVDRYYNTVGAAQLIPTDAFLMKYRPLDNDYFTDVKVSPIVDVLNLNSKNNFSLATNWLSRSNIGASPVLKSGDVGDSTYALAGSPTRSSSNPSTEVQTVFGFNSSQVSTPQLNGLYNGVDINTANIRAMFANEKLWSITGRAKKDYDSQTLAHFGFKVPHDVKHQISQFGHDITPIRIGEVISTSSTTQAPLGEIAGKGYARQSSERHKFTAPCHGVVMIIFSVVCRHNYEAGILKANCVASKNDFYTPEYDHLGMQPLFAFEGSYFDAADPAATKIYGWQYRYEQWKRRYNRTSAAFRNTVGSLKSWIPTYVPFGGNKFSYGQIKPDNLPNTDSFESFLNFPTDVNQIFLGQYPEVWSTAYEDMQGWAGIYDNDPFVIDSNIDAVLVSTMSDYSLPRLDA